MEWGAARWSWALPVLFLFVVAGCSAPGSAPRPVGPAAPSVPSTVPTSARTGLVERADGSVETSGYVGFSDIEGGFWALYDHAAAPSSATAPKIVVVLVPGRVPEASIAGLKGARVIVTGRLLSGLSTRQSGPEVSVDRIVPAATDAPR